MSEFTYGSLISGNDRTMLKKYCPRGSAICRLNERWTAFFTEEDGEISSPNFLLEISRELPVLYFYNLEDHCWGYQIWSQGEKVSSLHFSYEFEAELLFSVAQKRYPEQKNIASFLFEDEEGQSIYEQIESELSDTAFFEKELAVHFQSANTEAFGLFGIAEDTVEQLRVLLSVDTYLCSDDKHAVVEDFKRLLNIEEMSWARFDRIEQGDEGFEFV